MKEFFEGHLLLGYVTNAFVNKTEFHDNPVRSMNDVIFYEQLNYVEHIRKEVHLNYNEVELKDSYFLIWDEY